MTNRNKECQAQLPDYIAQSISYVATAWLGLLSAVSRLRMECTKRLISCGMASHSLSASCI